MGKQRSASTDALASATLGSPRRVIHPMHRRLYKGNRLRRARLLQLATQAVLDIHRCPRMLKHLSSAEPPQDSISRWLLMLGRLQTDSKCRRKATTSSSLRTTLSPEVSLIHRQGNRCSPTVFSSKCSL